MKQETILVVGASGTVGSLIAKELSERGYNVKATTSKRPSQPNQVQANVATGEGIRAAFEGVDKAFLLSPPGYADQHKMLSPLIQEAKRRGLKKVVLMTAMGANASDTTPFRRAEIELEKSGLNYNIIRPNWFMQNFNTFWAQGIRERGKIQLPAGTAKVSFIDVRDVASVAVKLLTKDTYNNQALDLSGPEGVDHSQVAAAISAVLGKSVEYEEIQPQILRDGLVGAGLPADYVDFMLLIFGFLREGYNAQVTSAVNQVLGRQPRGLSDYVRDYQTAWN